MFEKFASLFKMVPPAQRGVVLAVALICLTNFANHYYHQGEEDETRASLEYLVQFVADNNCNQGE